MTAVRMIGIDPEKRSFQLHGVRADDSAAFRKQASRGRVLAELSSHPRCVAAMAFQAFAPPLEGFQRGRDFAAWLGLVPRQHGTRGKARLGRVSKMDRRDLRHPRVSGAMTAIRHAARLGPGKDRWLMRMSARKPRMLVAVALANRMARMAWPAAKKAFYRVPAAVA